MSHRPKIHLVSYATPQFRHRQIILGLSARLNGVVDTVTAWTPARLEAAGFEKAVSGIGLNERGGGFWSWKPFIIQKRLFEVPEGDIVLYCDVGRIYPFKLLDQSVEPYLRWMEKCGQDVMPGIEIPWDGPVSRWTNRDALVALELDQPEIHAATPIQASFSLWRAGKKSCEFVREWLALCAQRRLISDDPVTDPRGNLQGFREHRHDQALLTLLCIKRGLSALSLGRERPGVDFRNPSEVSRIAFGIPVKLRRSCYQRKLILPLERLERMLRGATQSGF